MKKHTLTAMIVAIVAIVGLGVWLAPNWMDRDEAAAPAAAVTPAPDPAPTPRRAPARAARTAEATRVPAMPATQEELHDRLKPVLNRGTKMELAAAGFRDAEQFAMVAHAARNTGVPFAVLKHRVLEEDQTLARAIKSSKPEVDANREVTRAREAARQDILAIAS